MIDYTDINSLYAFVEKYVKSHNLEQSIKALPFAYEAHKNQLRKDKHCKVPYIAHPLLICCHAINMGLNDDYIIATALLHDVCEDCGYTIDELPVNESVRTAVGLLTKDDDVVAGSDKAREYYANIANNKIAIIVKLLDRCNNISSMSYAFSEKKKQDYIDRTKKYVFPLFDKLLEIDPEYERYVWLIKYHMISVIDAVNCK